MCAAGGEDANPALGHFSFHGDHSAVQIRSVERDRQELKPETRS